MGQASWRRHQRLTTATISVLPATIAATSMPPGGTARPRTNAAIASLTAAIAAARSL